jgi:hypothetical protein
LEGGANWLPIADVQNQQRPAAVARARKHSMVYAAARELSCKNHGRKRDWNVLLAQLCRLMLNVDMQIMIGASHAQP